MDNSNATNATNAQNTHTFSFFVGDKIPSDIEEKDNSYVEYIIYQNDMLHTKNRKLEEDIYTISTERDTYIEENERYEKGVTGLRGMAINEYEMSKMLENVIEGYKKVNRQEHTKLNDMYRMTGIYIVLSSIAIIVMLAGYDMFSVLNLGYMAFIMCCKKTYWNYSRPKLPQNYQDKVDEYKELRKNQSYIQQLVDAM